MCNVKTASLDELQASLWSSKHSDWDDTFRVNVTAHYFLAVALLKLLVAAGDLDLGDGRKGRDEGRGVMIITSSCASMHNCTNIDLTSYAASKAAIDHLVPLLASKFARCEFHWMSSQKDADGLGRQGMSESTPSILAVSTAKSGFGGMMADFSCSCSKQDEPCPRGRQSICGALQGNASRAHRQHGRYCRSDIIFEQPGRGKLASNMVVLNCTDSGERRLMSMDGASVSMAVESYWLMGSNKAKEERERRSEVCRHPPFDILVVM
jgi:hypothetical protein